LRYFWAASHWLKSASSISILTFENILSSVSAKRRISEADLLALQRWLTLEPQAPAGNWFKRFASFTLCGTAEITSDMKPHGEEIFEMVKQIILNL